jgi:lipopolysaccharide biosynthesis regulator YciM
MHCWCGALVNVTEGLTALEQHLESERHRSEMRERCPDCGLRLNWHLPWCSRISSVSPA